MQEIRHVIFNDREICEMVFNWLASRGDRRPITAARVEIGEEQNAVFIRMSYSEPASNERNLLVVSGREALAAVILYCRTHHVPLPMKAEKRIEIVRGFLTLVLSSQTSVRAS